MAQTWFKEEDDGRVVDIPYSHGLIVSIHLRCRPTTGYIWTRGDIRGDSLFPHHQDMLIPPDVLTSTKNSEDSTFVSNFIIEGRGEKKLEYIQQRPWNREELGRWSLTIRVT